MKKFFFRDGVRPSRPANEGIAGAGTRRATVKPLFPRFKRFKLRGYEFICGRDKMRSKRNSRVKFAYIENMSYLCSRIQKQQNNE